MYGSEVEPQVEAIKKIGPHEQCMVDDHVTDNTGLEGDPLDYSRYNKVVVLYLGGATTNTSGITVRVRLRKHHRSVYGNLKVPRPSCSG